MLLESAKQESRASSPSPSVSRPTSRKNTTDGGYKFSLPVAPAAGSSDGKSPKSKAAKARCTLPTEITGGGPQATPQTTKLSSLAQHADLAAPSSPVSPKPAQVQESIHDRIRGLGAMGHSAEFFSVRFNSEHDSWQLATTVNISSAAKAQGIAEQYIGHKLANAAAFISQCPRPHGAGAREWDYQPERNRLDNSFTEADVRQVCAAMYDLLAVTRREVPEKEALADEEDSEDEDDVSQELTGQTPHASRSMATLAPGTGAAGSAAASGGPPSLSIGNVEAALMAWDLTSELHGACRVAVTFVAQRCGRRYGVVCILVIHGTSVGVLVRSKLERMLHSPLSNRRLSATVDELASVMTDAGYEIEKVFVGLPSENPVPPREVSTRQVMWRFLKLNAVRQQWASILVSMDLYATNRDAICRAAAFFSSGIAAGESYDSVVGGVNNLLPAGFAVLRSRRRCLRLKVTRPVMIKRHRVGKRAPPPQSMSGGVLDVSLTSLNLSEAALWRNMPGDANITLNAPFRDPGHEYGQEGEICSSASSASLEEFAEAAAAPATPSQSTSPKGPTPSGRRSPWVVRINDQPKPLTAAAPKRRQQPAESASPTRRAFLTTPIQVVNSLVQQPSRIW